MSQSDHLKSVAQVFAPREFIENRIYLIRDHKVMVDSDLARLYGIPVKQLNQQVSRNIGRFPADFMFRLGKAEESILKSQIVTLDHALGRRPRARPRVFTEQGVAMLSSVLRSEQAIKVNVAIIRAFVKLRRLLSGNAELAKKLEKMEKQYDAQFRVVFKAIRQLMSQEDVPPQRQIGFTTDHHKP